MSRSGAGARSAGGFSLVELMVVTGIIALLAAVAMPAFARYVRRAKTAEVQHSLAKIGQGAKTYFHTAHVAADGSPLPKQFPSFAWWTPATFCCSQPGDKCAGSPAGWTAASWQALQFSIEGAHYYNYLYWSWGTDNDAQMWAIAWGDLDCDGMPAIWWNRGFVDTEGEPDVGIPTVWVGAETE